MNWSAHSRLTVVVLLAFVLSSCDSCGDKPSAPPPPEAPRPRGLLAELVLCQPKRSWQSARQLAGVGILLLPTQPTTALAPLLGLSETVARERFDTTAPWLWAIAATGDALSSAAALPLDKPSRFIDELCGGREAPFVAQGTKPELVFLRPAKTGLGLSLAVLDTHLLVGNNDAAVRQLGPYLVRTLARRKPPSVDVLLSIDGKSKEPFGKLTAPLFERARARLPSTWRGWWPALSAAFRSWLGSVEQLEARLSLTNDSLQVSAELTGKPPAASLPGAPLQRIDRLHKDAVAGWVIATTAAQRQALVGAVAKKGLAPLALDEAIAAPVKKAVQALAGTIGDSVVGQLSCDGRASTALWLSYAERAGLDNRGVELAALLKQQQLSAALQRSGLKLALSPHPDAGIAGLQRFSLLPSGKQAPNNGLAELLFVVEPRAVALAANRGDLARAERAMRQLRSAGADGTPSSSLNLGLTLAQHPPKVQLGLFVDPLRAIGCAQGRQVTERSGLILLSLSGRKRAQLHRLVVRLDVPVESLRAVMTVAALR